MTVDPLAARRDARALVEAAAAADEASLRFEGVNLSPALEQQLFFAVRDSRVPGSDPLHRVVGGAREVMRPLVTAAVGLAAWRIAGPGAGPLVVLVREPTHYPVLMQIEVELQAAAGESLALVRVGRAASVRPRQAIAPGLVELMEPSLALAALAHRRAIGAALRDSAGAWSTVVGEPRAGDLRRVAALEAGRIALGAAGLLSVARRWQPALLVGFDEVGTWARLLPEVARSRGIPSLDLPHAEAADPVAISGASYDCMATYGPRAAAVLESAGIPPDRIVEIGAPRFDPLVAMAAGAEPPSGPPRLVFAAQYVTGAMLPAVLEACYRAALSAAAAVAPAELVVVPHPAEPPGTAARMVAEHAAPTGVSVRLAQPGDLHAEVIRSTLLVTGWSNSVFEAAVAGVPAIVVNPGSAAPVDFAADGLALGAVDEASAAAAAISLGDETTRRTVIDRARSAAVQRLGPLDGQASARAAQLMLSLAHGEPRRSAA